MLMASMCGGGVVSAELRSLWISEYPEAAGEAESWSLAKKSRVESGGDAEALRPLFIVTSTDAASRSWTCWCFEMSSLEVRDHSGVCSHLADDTKKGQYGALHSTVTVRHRRSRDCSLTDAAGRGNTKCGEV